MSKFIDILLELLLGKKLPTPSATLKNINKPNENNFCSSIQLDSKRTDCCIILIIILMIIFIAILIFAIVSYYYLCLMRNRQTEKNNSLKLNKWNSRDVKKSESLFLKILEKRNDKSLSKLIKQDSYKDHVSIGMPTKFMYPRFGSKLLALNMDDRRVVYRKKDNSKRPPRRPVLPPLRELRQFHQSRRIETFIVKQWLDKNLYCMKRMSLNKNPFIKFPKSELLDTTNSIEICQEFKSTKSLINSPIINNQHNFFKTCILRNNSI